MTRYFVNISSRDTLVSRFLNQQHPLGILSKNLRSTTSIGKTCFSFLACSSQASDEEWLVCVGPFCPAKGLDGTSRKTSVKDIHLYQYKTKDQRDCFWSLRRMKKSRSVSRVVFPSAALESQIYLSYFTPLDPSFSMDQMLKKDNSHIVWRIGCTICSWRKFTKTSHWNGFHSVQFMSRTELTLNKWICLLNLS